MERQEGQADGRWGILAVWGTWLAVVLLLALFDPLPEKSASLVADMAVLLHMAVATLVMALTYPRKIAGILAISLILRTALVFWDVHFSHVYRLIHSGLDSESFFAASVAVSEDLSLLTTDIRPGIYAKVFGLLFSFIGPLRVFGQYTNALFGLTIVLLVYQLLRELKVDERTSTRTLLLAALLPNSLMLSAVYLRESVIAMLVAASLLFFVRWFVRGGPWKVVAASALVLLASTFHSGVIAILLGYVFVALFYDRDRRRFGFGAQSLPYFAIFAILIAITAYQYPDIFLGKFSQFESEADLLQATNYRLGGSAYLTGLTIDSYGELILYGPLRGLYFLGAPMPWDFRGAADVFAFATDSLFYVGTILLTIRHFRQLGDRRPMAIALLIIAGIAVLVFGAGVSNAGTALRHRYKLIAIFLALFATATDRSVATDSQPRALHSSPAGSLAQRPDAGRSSPPARLR